MVVDPPEPLPPPLPDPPEPVGVGAGVMVPPGPMMTGPLGDDPPPEPPVPVLPASTGGRTAGGTHGSLGVVTGV
jgi:hypothetical protein